MTKKFLMLTLISLPLLLAGCGGGNTSTSTYTSTYTPPPPLPPLIQAVDNNNFATAKRLIENGANVNVRETDGYTPLHYAKTREIVELLIENGANVNARYGEWGWTRLFYGPPEILTALIENGADVNIRDDDGQTALEFRIYNNDDGDYDDEIAVLRTNPAEIRARKARRVAAEKAEEEKRIAAEKAEEEERIAVAKAAEEKQKLQTLIPDLIARGAVDERDADTNTALHLAAKNNKPEYVAQLIQAGADINILNKKADTPLHLAVREGARDTALALLRAGGNPYTLNLKGKSALAIAVESGNEDLIGDFVLEGVDVSAIANLTQDKAQRDWEAEQERRQQAEAERRTAEAKLEAERLAEEAAATRSAAESEARRLAEAQKEAEKEAREAQQQQMWVDVAQSFAQQIDRAAQLKTNLDNTERANQQLEAAQQAAAAAADQAAAAAQQAAALQQIADQRTATAGGTGGASGSAMHCLSSTSQGGRINWANDCGSVISVGYCYAGRCGSELNYYTGGKFHLNPGQRHSAAYGDASSIEYMGCFGYSAVQGRTCE